MGDIIRKRRKERGLTLAELGRLVGVTSGHISQIERGRLEPSLGLLRRIAGELDIPMQEFFSVTQEENFMAIPASDTVAVQFPGFSGTCRLLSAGNKSDLVLGRRIKVIEAEISPGKWLTENTLQAGTDECCYITEGMLDFYIEDEIIRIRQGDSLFIPNRSKYHIFNDSDSPAKMLWAHAVEAALM